MFELKPSLCEVMVGCHVNGTSEYVQMLCVCGVKWRSWEARNGQEERRVASGERRGNRHRRWGHALTRTTPPMARVGRSRVGPMEIGS